MTDITTCNTHKINIISNFNSKLAKLKDIKDMTISVLKNKKKDKSISEFKSQKKKKKKKKKKRRIKLTHDFLLSNNMDTPCTICCRMVNRRVHH